MSMKAEADSLRLVQIERRLAEIGSAARGQREFHADRLNDCLEQIEELRKELKTLAERVDRMAGFLNQMKQQNGNHTPG